MKWIQSWLLDKGGSFDCGCFIGVGVQHFQRSLKIHLKLSLCCVCRGGNGTHIPHTSNYSSAVLSLNTKHLTVLLLHFASRYSSQLYLKTNPHYIPINVLPHLQPPRFPHHLCHHHLPQSPFCPDVLVPMWCSQGTTLHFKHRAKDFNHSPLWLSGCAVSARQQAPQKCKLPN